MSIGRGEVGNQAWLTISKNWPTETMTLALEIMIFQPCGKKERWKTGGA